MLYAVAFAIVRYVLPIGPLNSTDGTDYDNQRTAAGALLVYYVVAFVFVASTHRRGCDALEDQASGYLYNPAPPIPSTLTRSAYA